MSTAALTSCTDDFGDKTNDAPAPNHVESTIDLTSDLSYDVTDVNSVLNAAGLSDYVRSAKIQSDVHVIKGYYSTAPDNNGAYCGGAGFGDPSCCVSCNCICMIIVEGYTPSKSASETIDLMVIANVDPPAVYEGEAVFVLNDITGEEEFSHFINP